MSYKPDEKDWMAYLYGESEGQEKEKMDEYLLKNPEARIEFEKFQSLRKLMSSVEDKEVIAPPIFIDNSKNRLLWNNPYLKTVLSIAATLLLILLVGKVTDTKISVSGNEFKMSFGEVKNLKPTNSKEENKSTLSPEQVQDMINNSLNKNNMAMQSSWKETQQKLDASIKNNLAVNSTKINMLVRQASLASQDQIRSYIAGLQNENIRQVKDYFQLTSGEQKKYIEDLLVDFSQYLQQQRNNDLQVVETKLNSLEQNTNIFKQETEQILSSIITTVGAGQPSNEIKN